MTLLIYYERHKAGNARPLDRDGQLALVPSANAGAAPRHDFAVRRNKPAQSRRFLIINYVLGVGAERTDVVFWFAGRLMINEA